MSVVQSRANRRGPSRCNEQLWQKIKKHVTDEYRVRGEWSARKAQLLTRKYKKSGGTFCEKYDPRSSLATWTRQKWKTKSGKPSTVTGERYLPHLVIKLMPKSMYAATSAKKRKDSKSGIQYSKQPPAAVKYIKSLSAPKMKL